MRQERTDLRMRRSRSRPSSPALGSGVQPATERASRSAQACAQHASSQLPWRRVRNDAAIAESERIDSPWNGALARAVRLAK